MKAYRIVNWDKRYEVDSKSRAVDKYIPVDDRRKGPLKYVRSKVHGWHIGPGLDELIARSWQPGSLFHWAVFGIFHKLLEIAADQPRDYRGWILDTDQRPIGPDYFIRRFKEQSPKLICEVFEILCHPDINWLELHDVPEICGKSGKSATVPESLYNQTETQHNSTQNNDPEKTDRQKKIEQQKKALMVFNGK
jgi:hypothetical protein